MNLPKLLTGPCAALLFSATLPSCTQEAKLERSLDAAKEHFENAEYEAAEIEFKNALEIEPGNPKALKGLGQLWCEQGASFDAARILSSAKQALPYDDTVALKLAGALNDLGFIGDARQTVLELLDRSPANGEALMLLAETSRSQEALEEATARIKDSMALDQPQVMLAAALVELRSGRIDSGTELMEKALEADPDFPRALALKGTIQRVNKQPQSALAPLKKAAELAGPRSIETLGYASLLMELMRKDEATAVLEAAAAAAPDYLPNHRMLAQIAFTSGDDEAAAAHLRKVLDKSPLDIEAALIQSRLWIKQQQAEKAVELLTKLNETFPFRPLLELELSKAQLAASDPLKAAQSLDRVLTVAPDAAEAILMRSQIHLNNQEYNDAITALEDLVNKQPGVTAAPDLLIQAYVSAGRNEQAINLLKQVAERREQDPEPLLKLGQLHQAKGDTSEARKWFEKAAKLAPDNVEAVAALAGLDLAGGQGGEAISRIDTFISTHPQVGQAYYVKATLLANTNDFPAAELALKKAIELKPDDLASHVLLVQLQTQTGRPEEAIKQLQSLLEVLPDHSAVLMNLGSLMLQLERYDEAKSTFEKLVGIEPNNSAAYNNLAYLDSEIFKDLDQAVVNANKARSLAPDDPMIADTLGWIEWQQGNYSVALPLLKEAADQLSTSATILYHLAWAQSMMGQQDEAIASLKNALALPGEFPEKADAESRLATLSGEGPVGIGTLRKLTTENPKDIPSLLRLAAALAETGEAEEALSSYQKALDVNPRLDSALLGQAELYLKALKQPAKALETAKAARSINPNSSEILAVLGAAHLQQGDHELAYGFLKQAATRLKDKPEVQRDYGRAAFSLGRVEESREALAPLARSESTDRPAIIAFLALTAADAAAKPETADLVKEVLATDPDDVAALMAAAVLQEKEGKSPSETYAKILSIYPLFDPARVALATCYLEDPEQLDKALDLAKEARTRRPDDLELIRILAIGSYRKGDNDYAAQLLKEIAGKRSLTPSEKFTLGMSLAATGHSPEATIKLEEALKEGLAESESSEARAALKGLAEKEADE